MTRSAQAQVSGRAPGLILLVEDDPRLRLLVAEFLRGEGFPVDVAGTGHEALEQIEWERPELILLDIHLPDMNGSAFARELQARGVVVPIIVMTAAHDAREWAQAIGAVSYIPKPVSLPSLIRRLDALSA
jgi:DNA-binding response OmpR family regulator